MSEKKEMDRPWVDDPALFPWVYHQISQEEGAPPLPEGSLLDPEAIHHLQITRTLATRLIDEEKGFSLAECDQAIERWQIEHHTLAPQGHLSQPRRNHILKILTLYATRSDLRHLLKRASPPLNLPIAETLIRLSLSLPHGAALTPVVVQRAFLSAHLSYLRQNLGSCFATAPAIRIQREEPERFLQDLLDLTGRGFLSRVLRGEERRAPLSPCSGWGEVLAPLRLFPRPERYAQDPALIAAFQGAGLIEAGGTEELAEMLKRVGQDLLQQRGAQLTSIYQLLQRALQLKLYLDPESVSQERTAPHHFSAMGGALALTQREDPIRLYWQQLKKGVEACRTLTDHALLKGWEYSLASFAEAGGKLTEWSLVQSLGFREDDEGGVGPLLFSEIQRHHQELKEEVEGWTAQIEGLRTALEVSLIAYQQRGGEEGEWRRLEVQRRRGDLERAESDQARVVSQANAFAKLYPELVDHLLKLLPSYFQEVYDPQIRLSGQEPHEDAPAGFRLYEKHGRERPDLWSAIQNPDGFIEALAHFFYAIEQELLSGGAYRHLGKRLSELISSVIIHIRSPRFLESAIRRVARARGVPLPKNPVETWQALESTPWAYISGASMLEVLAAYYALDEFPTRVERKVENPQDLAYFLLDTLKEIPQKQLAPLHKDPSSTLFIHSPTHGFLLEPYREPFYSAWKDPGHSPTYFRDRTLAPAEDFWYEIRLGQEEEHHLARLVMGIWPAPFAHLVREAFHSLPQKGRVRPFELRDALRRRLEQEIDEKSCRILLGQVDGLLYRELPLQNRVTFEKQLTKIASLLAKGDRALEEALSLEKVKAISQWPQRPFLIGAMQFYQILLALIVRHVGRTTSPLDWPLALRKEMARAEALSPLPLIFADTNWNHQRFALLVNPGTLKCDLWRCDPIGLQGLPMIEWHSHFLTPQHPWAIYTNPKEYS